MLDVTSARPNILIIEDSDDVVDEISGEILAVLPLANIEIASNHDEAEVQIEQSLYEVASVDWELESHGVGAGLVKILRHKRPDTERIVYTQYAKRDEAKNAGADQFFQKREPTYASGIVQGVKNSIARQLSSVLVGRGDRSTLVPERRIQVIDAGSDAQLLQYAKNLAVKARLHDLASDKELESLLNRRGHWELFDISNYISLPTAQKLALLVRLGGLSEDALATSIGINSVQIKQCLREPSLLNEYEIGIQNRANELLSVVTYFLKVAQYQPVVMAELCHATGFFAKSSTLPPWDLSGIDRYLATSGPHGLSDALSWIRSH